jgi:cobalt-zinc-cadmium efflux system membrane fusion protein
VLCRAGKDICAPTLGMKSKVRREGLEVMIMKIKNLEFGLLTVSMASLLALGGCGKGQGDIAAQEAPPPAQVVPGPDAALITVDHPEQYPLVATTAYTSTATLAVTGTVNPDIARNVPVVTLASGKVVAIHARLGDAVQKDQVLLTIRSDDVSGGYSDYRKAIADELLARKQFERAKDLYDHGAIALNDLEVAQDTEDKAKVDVETMAEHLRLLGNDPDNPNFLVDIKAPVSGVVTDQEVTNAATVQAYGTNPFTISDLSSVWVVCDVYENDLPSVHVGDAAQIVLNAYPDRKIPGRVGNIGATMDPNIRTAKVRLEVANPGGIMRIGMFATATFRGQKNETYAQVPATAIMHLQDRDWVFEPTPDKKFRRVEIHGGDMLPNKMQEVLSGLQPGQRVVTNAIVLENTFENQ